MPRRGQNGVAPPAVPNMAAVRADVARHRLIRLEGLNVMRALSFRSSRSGLVAVVLVGLSVAAIAKGAEPASNADPIRVLIVTGGHGFPEKEFDALFRSMPNLAIETATVPQDADRLKDDLADSIDVIVLYDLWATGITPEQQKTVIRLLKRGIGVCALHHTLASHQEWPEYAKILGGKYYLAPRTVDGKKLPRSMFRHDQDIPVQIADRDHPITRGLNDFTIHDETYRDYDVSPAVHVLLTTDHPLSHSKIAWVNRYANSRIFYLQLGHDQHAYRNANYREIVLRAIRWCAGRPASDDAPWRSLFNGRNLDGWEAKGGAVWEVRDGVLVGRQGPDNAPGDLFTKDSFGDAEIRVTYRVTWPANTGVWYRYQSPKKAYQADILEYQNPVAWSGTLYCPGKMFLAINKDPGIVDRNGWNTLVIRTAENRHVVLLNGHKVADVRDDGSRRGRIGFQVHRGKQFGRMKIEVKEIAVRPL